MHHDAVMKRITISLEDDLYRIVKAYAIGEDLSLSKAVVRFLERGVEGGRSARVAEEADGASRYLEPRTGILVSLGGERIPEDAAQLSEEEEDLRKWNGE